MDTLIISNENNILHIYNEGNKIDYTIYNSKGHNMDGGVLQSSNGIFDNDFAIKEVLNIVKDNYDFNLPYIYLSGEKAESLLELIEFEDYKNTNEKVSNYLSSIKQNVINEINIEI